MQKQQKCHNNLLNEIDCDDNGLEFDYSDQYISENCSMCHDEMTDINDIWVTESDQYICSRCKVKYRINAVRCRDLD